eukprot:m.124778 g.124778  ORF g.124778 m.124778 type:complete len:703 (-) comp12963_c1_seq3:909-3017(-)
MPPLTYPPARRGDDVEDFHGQKIADPYKWLEDPDAEATKKFVDMQNDISEPFRTGEFKQKFLDRLKTLYNFPKQGCPFKKGKYYHFFNTGLQNHSVLYQRDTLDDEPKVFLDPNSFSEDGTTALGSISFSEDYSLLAYCIAESGSDWKQIKVRNTETGEDLDDHLKWVKFTTLTWTHDNKGFFYNKYNPPKKEGVDAGTETDINLDQKLMYHRIGTDQSEDVLVYEMPDNPKWMSSVTITKDGKYLVLSISEGCDPVNRFYVTECPQVIDGKIEPKKLIDNFDAGYNYIANVGSRFTLLTNHKASNYKLITVDVDADEFAYEDLVAEEESLLASARWVDSDKLILNYLKDVKDTLQLNNLSDGKLIRHIDIPVGTVGGWTMNYNEPELFFSFTSFLTPGTIYRLDVSSVDNNPQVFYETKVEGFDASKFVTKQVFYESKDGTKVPMFIVHRKDIEHNGLNPTLLYGYGGFNISLQPYFSTSRAIFCGNMKGVMAIANIRGGGEYGEKWHKDGSLANKQNCFDDFQCAAEYLISEKITSPQHLAIQGGSNGGLLVAACCNQRPDLFGAAIAQVGVMDMLHFHKFTIGHAWTTDYGCSDDEEQFQWLIKYSPLHNVKRREDTQYPAMMLSTGDHDDRVVPLHTLKLLATLQHELGDDEKQTNPLLVRVEVKAGHGAGKPTEKRLEEIAEEYTFLSSTLNIAWEE